MRGNRIDTNQPAIVKAVRAVGAKWKPLTGDPNIGADGLILFRGTVYVCEIKDPAKPPSARKLTQNELDFQADCASAKIPYVVLLTPEQALLEIGATK